LDAEEWIYSDDRSWPFSFENVCDLLQINPAYLRHGLIAWKDRQLNGHPRAKVVTLKVAAPDRQPPDSLQQANAR
jgi:hypothetical protein